MILFLRLKLHSARLIWPATVLVLLLQRTPLLRFLTGAEFMSGGRVGQMLRAMLPVTAALGATHTLTGQTRWTGGATELVTGQVGEAIGPGGVGVAFAFTGTSATPESYSIVGTLPPGITVPGATGNADNLTLNSGSGGAFSGVPTALGDFSVVLTAFDSPNRGLGEHGSSPPLTVNFSIQDSTAPPVFTTHPLTQTVAHGGSVTLTVVVTGSPAPTLQWRKDTVNIPGQTGSSLALTDLELDAAGSYDVVAINTVDTATSNAAVLTISPPAAPTILTQPIAITSRENSSAFFAVMADGIELEYQWTRDGVDLSGETNSSLFLANVGADNAADYAVRISSPGGAVESVSVPLNIVTTGNVRLSNLSARALVGVGADVLIPGFVVGGSGDKTVLVRAVGPKLGDLGVGGFLADPSMQLFRGPVAGEANDDWTEFSDQALLEDTRASVFAFPLVPSGQPQKDAAMVVSLAAGSTNYTVQTVGVGETTGVGLVELFDADPPNPTARFINISARAQVGTGNDVLIPGFFIEGNVALTLLIRAVGPTLGELGVAGTLDDPIMTLFRVSNTPNPGDQEVMTINDDWEQTPNLAAMEAAREATLAFNLSPGSADAALLVALNPGGYTVKVEGKDGTTGVALVEIYLVGP